MRRTAPLAKLPPGGSYLFMKYDVFRQNAEFFLGIELINVSIRFNLICMCIWWLIQYDCSMSILQPVKLLRHSTPISI